MTTNYNYSTPGTSGYVLDTESINQLTESAVEKVKNIQLPSKTYEAEAKAEEEEEKSSYVEQSTLPDNYSLSTSDSGVDLKDQSGNIIKSFTTEEQAIDYANDRNQVRDDLAQREEYGSAIGETIDDLSQKLSRYEQIAENADLTTEAGQSAYFASLQQQELMNQQLLTLQLLNQQLNTKVKNEDGEEEDKWGLKEIGMILTLTASGLTLGDSLVKLFEDDDIAPIDVKEELYKAIELQTSPEFADKMINASFRDMPRITDLENLANYRNQFGSLSNEIFNDPNYGGVMEEAYQAFLVDNPGVNRDQFLAEFSEANPTSPISQKIQYDMSRMGQLEKSSNALFNINTNQTMAGFENARNFYKPLNEGGMGFRPDDFRSQEQKDITASAMGLVNNPDMQMLKDSVGRRVRQQGKLGTDELRDITGSALTSVDPSLQNQAYLRSGGLARSILNTSGAMRNRLIADENQYASLMGEDRSNITTANNVIASNTINPAEAFGLKGTNTNLANQIYGSNPTQGLNYDPTSQYFSSMASANANIRSANAMQPGIGSKATNVADDFNSFYDNYKKYQG